MEPYLAMIETISEQFGSIILLAKEDGTLSSDLSSKAMFTASLHLMLAAATRYAVGLIYEPEGGSDPEQELILLKEMLLARFKK